MASTPSRCNFVETAFPQMNEITEVGRYIDAAITAEPFQSRIIKVGTGSMMAYFTRELPEDLPIVFFALTPNWATTNRSCCKGFS